MEDSEERRERLKTMRQEAAVHEQVANESILILDGSLTNPFIENATTTLIQESAVNPRFGFYTDPMAAFSANKKSKTTGSHPFMPLIDTENPAPQYFSPISGPANPGTSYPINRPQQSYSSPDMRYQANSHYSGFTPHRSPAPDVNPFPTHQGPQANYGFAANMRPVLPACGFDQMSRHIFNRAQGIGCWQGNPGSGHHGRRSQGFPPRNLSPDCAVRSCGYYNKSMVEDPWKNLTAIVWKILDSPRASLSSWLPKSISTEKAKVPALFNSSKTKTGSQPTLAEYLDASFTGSEDDLTSV